MYIRSIIKITLILLLINSILYIYLYNSDKSEFFTSAPIKKTVDINNLDLTLNPVRQMFKHKITNEIAKFKTKLECKDFLRIKFLENNGFTNLEALYDEASDKTIRDLDKQCEKICRINNKNPLDDFCNPNVCLYKEISKSVPEKVNELTLEKMKTIDNSREATISWFKPDSPHQILKYIIIIEPTNSVENYAPSRIQYLRNNLDKSELFDGEDLIRYTVYDLKPDIGYTINVAAINEFGKGAPSNNPVNITKDLKKLNLDVPKSTQTSFSNKEKIQTIIDTMDKYYSDREAEFRNNKVRIRLVEK